MLVQQFFFTFVCELSGPPCKKTFDVRAILDRRRDLFILDQHGGRVTYCFQDNNQDSLFAGDGGSAPLLYSSVVVERREAAKRRLRFILVEGLFVYFFAKFCHGPRFKIKVKSNTFLSFSIQSK